MLIIKLLLKFGLTALWRCEAGDDDDDDRISVICVHAVNNLA
jgi:hypothetical protein